MQSNIRNRTYGNTYTNQILQMRNTKKKKRLSIWNFKTANRNNKQKSTIFKTNKFMSDNLE